MNDIDYTISKFLMLFITCIRNYLFNLNHETCEPSWYDNEKWVKKKSKNIKLSSLYCWIVSLTLFQYTRPEHPNVGTQVGDSTIFGSCMYWNTTNHSHLLSLSGSSCSYGAKVPPLFSRIFLCATHFLIFLTGVVFLLS